VKSSVEPLEGNRVKISVNIDESEFDRDIDQAFRKIAREVRLPGFRNGKAPRRVLEARIGIAPAREQALRDAIPVYLAKAVRDHEVDLIATPEVEITEGEETGPVAFDATLEVRPEISVPGYGGLRVELPSPEATDDEVDEAVAAELRRHGQLDDAGRPSAAGDYITVDISATRDGEEVAGLNTEDWSYEVGQGWIADGFDEQVTGVLPGVERRFSATPKGTGSRPTSSSRSPGCRSSCCPSSPTSGWPTPSGTPTRSKRGARASANGCRAASSTRRATSSSAGSPRRSPA
jgi:trigger factor